MPYYSVGDRVVVRPDLNLDDDYSMFFPDGTPNEDDSNCAVSDMVRLAGKVVTIERAKCGSHYRVEESTWNWTDEMFLGLEEEILYKESTQEVDPDALMAMIGGG